MFDYLFLLVGLALLLLGGDWLVRGAVGLAERLSVPPLIIGLTIVSVGTSAPELFVSVKAAISGAGGIAIGNVVGSNIANVLMVMGIPAMIMATTCDQRGIGRNIVFMLAVSVLFIAMVMKGTLERYDGVVLLFLLAVFLFDQFRRARKVRANTERKFDYHDEVDNIPSSGIGVLVALAIGLVALPVGAEATVNSAVSIARAWHVSEEVIGLTIVALGTSLPELATTLMAVMRNNSSVALGNIVGSNIFNIAAIMGVAALIVPIPVGGHIITLDIWVMLATSLFLGLLAHFKLSIGRALGAAMTLAYAAYIVTAYSY